MRIQFESEGRANFHNVKPIRMNLRPAQGGGYWLSARQLKRLRAHFCGLMDCMCGSGPYIEEQFGGERDGWGWIPPHQGISHA